MSWAVVRWRRLKAWFVRAVQDWDQIHVPDRCQREGCDCPCGWCIHGRQHVPGGSR